MSSEISEELRRRITASQRDEITEHVIYRRLAESAKDERNREVLTRLSDDELAHYEIWRELSGVEMKPSSLRVKKYVWISRLFGLTFGLKLMESGEERAQEFYQSVAEQAPQALEIAKDETQHEQELVGMIDEERLKYVSSMVLGLNDALVELTGALAGFTFALQDARLVAMTGLITGIAASLSMGTSEYLSTKSEGEYKSPTKASMYTTLAYLMTVISLVAPFLLLNSIYLSLGMALVNAILILFVFTFYISVAKSLPFRRRFLETASISLGVAGLTFVIGLFVRLFFGIEV
ncbi:MAG: VIT1/CCC1 transporter family protein [Candidatus Thorarchaeota archaeon]|nr:VIT1/CCC1 transporter family protein [Candidatus Thorarchaeota archaeon]